MKNDCNRVLNHISLLDFLIWLFLYMCILPRRGTIIIYLLRISLKKNKIKVNAQFEWNIKKDWYINTIYGLFTNINKLTEPSHHIINKNTYSL